MKLRSTDLNIIPVPVAILDILEAQSRDTEQKMTTGNKPRVVLVTPVVYGMTSVVR